MLDTSKAFDRVNYCMLCNKLIKQRFSLLILRLLLFMYTNEAPRVIWGIHF